MNSSKSRASSMKVTMIGLSSHCSALGHCNRSVKKAISQGQDFLVELCRQTTWPSKGVAADRKVAKKDMCAMCSSG